MADCYRRENYLTGYPTISDRIDKFPVKIQGAMKNVIRQGAVTQDEKACWVWNAGRSSNGYGRLCDGAKPIDAHRMMAKICNEGIPDGKIVLHSCHNPCCVNPDHLSIGTHKENAWDRSKANRSNHKLSEGACIEIVWLRYFTKLSLVEMAKAYGVSKTAIRAVETGRTRPYLPRP